MALIDGYFRGLVLARTPNSFNLLLSCTPLIATELEIRLLVNRWKAECLSLVPRV